MDENEMNEAADVQLRLPTRAQIWLVGYIQQQQNSRTTGFDSGSGRPWPGQLTADLAIILDRDFPVLHGYGKLKFARRVEALTIRTHPGQSQQCAHPTKCGGCRRVGTFSSDSRSFSKRAPPKSMAMCPSCPQACIAPWLRLLQQPPASHTQHKSCMLEPDEQTLDPEVMESIKTCSADARV